MTATAAAAMPLVIRFDSRADWLAERRKRVQASEAAAVCGVDPFQSAYSLWCEKVGLLDGGAQSDDDISEAAFWGTALEPVIADRYALESGSELEDLGRTTILVGDHPDLGATLDRKIAASGEDGPGILEIKAPGFLQREKWEEGPPEKVVLQVQAQLAVTGYRWGVVAALLGGQDFRTFRVERDDELIALLYESVDSFMRCVREKAPPAPDGSEATLAAIKRIFPQDSGTEVDLPDFLPWAERLEKAKEAAALWKKEQDLCEAHLKAAIGTATVARIGDRTYTCKASNRAGYTVEPCTYRSLRLQKATTSRKRK